MASNNTHDDSDKHVGFESSFTAATSTNRATCFGSYEAFTLPNLKDVGRPSFPYGQDRFNSTRGAPVPFVFPGIKYSKSFGDEPETRSVSMAWAPVVEQPQAKSWNNAPSVPKSKSSQKKLSAIPYGWGDMVDIRTLPVHFPYKNMLIRNAMPIKSLTQVLKRLEKFIRSESIQASYKDEPLEAKLQTFENCELYLDFWKSTAGDEFYIDISRRRGDHFTAQMYINKLLNAAKGVSSPFEASGRRVFDSKPIQNFESFLNAQMASTTCAGPMPMPSLQEATTIAIQNIHAALVSSRLDSRTSGLKRLVGITDLKQTMSPTACSAALAVLSGRSKDPELADEALDIHETIMLLLFEKDFLGDGELFAMKDGDMDIDDIHVEPFFPNPTLKRNRPRYYEEFMNDLHHMALTIFVQALEVATCFQDEMGHEIRNFCEIYVRQGIQRILNDCIAKVSSAPLENQSLSTGCLACKALRILASTDSFLRNRVSKDSRTRKNILEAAMVGKARHAMLEDESERLLSTVCG